MVSVIIVNYHCAELTAVAVKSAYEDCETCQVVVVDNSECDEEEKKLRTLLPNQAEIIVSSSNVGFGKACNLGYTRCIYEYIFLLNPDTKLIKGCMQQLKEALDSDATLGAVSPQSFWDEKLDFFLPPGQMQTPFWEFLNSLGYRWLWFGEKFSQWFRRYTIATITTKKPISQCMVSGGHMMVTKSTVKKLGYLFDEAFFLYYEDTDLNLRIRKLGLELALIPDAKVIHFWQSNAKKGTFCPQSRQIYMNKHFKISLILKIKEFIEKFSAPLLGKYTDMGILLQPPKFEIQNNDEEWVLEISLGRLFIPSVTQIGRGKECFLPYCIWELLESGEYWARIGNLKTGGEVFKWIKA